MTTQQSCLAAGVALRVTDCVKTWSPCVAGRAKGPANFQPGPTAQEKSLARDEGLKARTINRAFSPVPMAPDGSWAVGPGWKCDAPLALADFSHGLVSAGSLAHS